MISDEWETQIRKVIENFHAPHRDEILGLWNRWLTIDVQSPYHESWSEFASTHDDQEALYTETRVYIKRVANELKELETPPTVWRKMAKALAAVASLVFVIFLAMSRVARASD